MLCFNYVKYMYFTDHANFSLASNQRMFVFIAFSLWLSLFNFFKQGDNTIVPVAVKSLRTDVERDDRIAFLKEAIIMGQFFHRNVVTMFGVVVDCDPVRKIRP